MTRPCAAYAGLKEILHVGTLPHRETSMASHGGGALTQCHKYLRALAPQVLRLTGTWAGLNVLPATPTMNAQRVSYQEPKPHRPLL